MEKYLQNIKTPNKNSESLDYNDVFGGPPRRFSMQEMRVRHSLSDLLATEHEEMLMQEARVARKPNLSDNFFDDIFRSPMRTHHDCEKLVGSSQSSRITSPAARAEHTGTSRPPQSSIPAKWTKPMFPTSASENQGQFDGTVNRINATRSSSSSSFRFCHRSPLASFSSEDSSSTATSDPKVTVQSSKKNNKMESSTGGDRFHFSIYKWTGRGVPVLTPHIERSNIRELKTDDRFPSSGGKTDGESTQNESPKATKNQGLPEKIEPDSLKTECEEKQNNGLNLKAARGKEQDEAKVFTAESFSSESKILENSDDHFEDFFLVQELSNDDETVTQSNEDCDGTKDLDTRILQWSVGKKGNIRSLLSNLQYVLWPGNGWQPIPLVDLIEVNAVKRAYQKALLRIHPDKLQQTDAASNHKYIAEKVFDILQEAWDQFTALAPL